MTYLTPEEAKKELCPFFQCNGNVGLAMDIPWLEHMTCRGPECRIAWRERHDGKGYCGMAGRPNQEEED